MAFTQIDLDNIERAIAKGRRRVQVNGKIIEYQTLSEMLRARDDIQKAVIDDTLKAAGKRRRTSYRAMTGRGL